jgi:hypothetical protein
MNTALIQKALIIVINVIRHAPHAQNKAMKSAPNATKAIGKLIPLQAQLLNAKILTSALKLLTYAFRV